MNVYIVRGILDDYQMLLWKGENIAEFTWRFDGTSRTEPLGNASIALLAEDDAGNRLLASDFPALSSHIPVFSRKAFELLSDLLRGNGQPFPITLADQEYVLFNVTRLIDALDEDESELERFESSGRIMHIVRHAFRVETLRGVTIFKVSQTPRGYVYVTDIFRDRVESCKLTGFRFTQVWSDRT